MTDINWNDCPNYQILAAKLGDLHEDVKEGNSLLRIQNGRIGKLELADAANKAIDLKTKVSDNEDRIKELEKSDARKESIKAVGYIVAAILGIIAFIEKVGSIIQ